MKLQDYHWRPEKFASERRAGIPNWVLYRRALNGERQIYCGGRTSGIEWYSLKAQAKADADDLNEEIEAANNAT